MAEGQKDTTLEEKFKRILSRRETLRLLGGAGVMLLAGCGTDSGTPSAIGTSTTGGTTGTTSGATSTTGSATTTTGATTGTTGTATSATGTATSTTGTTTSTASKAVTPEGEIGPYFTDDSAAAYNRSNILANIDGSNPQTGLPLSLTLSIFDSQNNNAPIAGAQVDIWHCNALGVYSNEAVENTSGQSWLRGYQITDANGQVTFNTVVPGWYQGRATHIHLRIRSQYSQAASTSDGSNTTQLFIPQATLDSIYTTVTPYSTRGLNTTPNASDHVYTPETHGLTVLTLSGSSASGFTALFPIYLPITAE